MSQYTSSGCARPKGQTPPHRMPRNLQDLRSRQHLCLGSELIFVFTIVEPRITACDKQDDAVTNPQ